MHRSNSQTPLEAFYHFENLVSFENELIAYLFIT